MTEPTSSVSPSDHEDSQSTEGISKNPSGSEPTVVKPPGARVPYPERETLVLGLPLSPSSHKGAIGRLGEYDVLNHIGRGGMGLVVRAFDGQLHRNVAIKVMSPDLLASDSARERFFREARAAAGISHPNVVTIHAVSQAFGKPFLVMEFIDGKTLHARIKDDAPLKVVDLLRISSQVAQGLAAAHRHGVIHRDIKPANILLEDGIERVKISDFGLARLAMERSDLTSLGNVVGTPSFMSPEQVEGKDLDHRSDLFSLGCVMYAMVVGQSPFRANNAIATGRRVVSERHPSIADAGGKLPRELADVIDRLLEKNPEDRFQTADEVADLLTRYLARENQKPSTGDDSTRALPQKYGPQKSRWSLVLGAVVVATAALLAVMFGPKTSQKGTEPTFEQADSSNSPGGVAATVHNGPTGNSFLSDGVLTVAADGSAEYTDITTALHAARPGIRISITDSSTYKGPLLISGPHVQNITIEAPQGAALMADDHQSVIRVLNTAHLVISGFRIDTDVFQHAVEAMGACPGMHVHDCQFHSLKPRDSPIAVVYLHDGFAGTPEDPVRLEKLDIRCGGVGIVVGGAEDTACAQSLRIDNCRIQGTTDYGIPIVMQAKVADIGIRRNLMTTGTTGVSVAIEMAENCQDIVIAENTFHNLATPLMLALPPDVSTFRIRSNLFVAADRVTTATGSVYDYANWFDGNWWEPGFDCDDAQAALIATVKPSLPFVSRDPDRKEFLVPETTGADQMPGHLMATPEVSSADEAR